MENTKALLETKDVEEQTQKVKADLQTHISLLEKMENSGESAIDKPAEFQIALNVVDSLEEKYKDLPEFTSLKEKIEVLRFPEGTKDLTSSVEAKLSDSEAQLATTEVKAVSLSGTTIEEAKAAVTQVYTDLVMVKNDLEQLMSTKRKLNEHGFIDKDTEFSLSFVALRERFNNIGKRITDSKVALSKSALQVQKLKRAVEDTDQWAQKVLAQSVEQYPMTDRLRKESDAEIRKREVLEVTKDCVNKLQANLGADCSQLIADVHQGFDSIETLVRALRNEEFESDASSVSSSSSSSESSVVSDQMSKTKRSIENRTNIFKNLVDSWKKLEYEFFLVEERCNKIKIMLIDDDISKNDQIEVIGAPVINAELNSIPEMINIFLDGNNEVQKREILEATENCARNLQVKLGADFTQLVEDVQKCLDSNETLVKALRKEEFQSDASSLSSSPSSSDSSSSSSSSESEATASSNSWSPGGDTSSISESGADNFGFDMRREDRKSEEIDQWVESSAQMVHNAESLREIHTINGKINQFGNDIDGNNSDQEKLIPLDDLVCDRVKSLSETKYDGEQTQKVKTDLPTHTSLLEKMDSLVETAINKPADFEAALNAVDSPEEKYRGEGTNDQTSSVTLITEVRDMTSSGSSDDSPKQEEHTGDDSTTVRLESRKNPDNDARRNIRIMFALAIVVPLVGYLILSAKNRVKL
ncbi:Oidioi.mRNA.OKI2018_I69.PAR.g10989.t1.cds [Oikopleura dioica]|uniref:Oidioi.mRNA.OKI2018_I69.PAR.g10989.t1.cds n=1 Tax=Oikopleura dioica TaxID=34765 RepID=A0ABN7RTR3_OIKDI|nr:Oidioi.mRNA.OKI2018_I69.PAR.g10989.t1.cds [Oikopleura dioica]